MKHHKNCPGSMDIEIDGQKSIHCCCPNIYDAESAAVEAATKDLEESNARLTANRCACDVDAAGDVCLTHQRKIDAAAEAERKACEWAVKYVVYTGSDDSESLREALAKAIQARSHKNDKVST